MSQFLTVLRFELAFRRRHPPLWIFTGVCFLFAFLSVALEGGMEGFGANGAVAINSPSALTIMMLVYCLVLGLVITTAFVAGSVNRDLEYGASELFFATPLRKLPYLLGRFWGSILAAWFMISGLALGAMLASVMPWLDPERILPFNLTPYLYSLGVFLFPNLLLIGAIAFAVATLTRKIMFSYVALLGLVVVYLVSGAYLADLDNEFIAAISDPFGIRAYAHSIRYWTPAEMNSIGAPFTAEILINRALWSTVGLALLGLTLVRYRMALPSSGRAKGGKLVAPESEPESSAEPATALPELSLRYDWRSRLAGLGVQTRVEIRGLVRSAPFLLVALAGVGNTLGLSFAFSRTAGATTLPVTHLMLNALAAGMLIFMLIVLVFYAGELVHRERKHKINELFDTLPMPNWVPLLAKLAAMLVGMLVLLLLAAATTIAVQLGKGYTNLELGLYLRHILLVQAPQWIVLGATAVVVQVFVNHKFMGYLVMVLVFIMQIALVSTGFEHNLYNYASYPSVTYSDMNGYGHFVAGRAAFTVYWGAAAVVLVLLAELAWVRGTDTPLKLRLRAARARLTRGRAVAIGLASLVWAGTGGFIFYNTNILNDYLPSDAQERLQARYERDYKQYQGLAQPRITAVEIDATIEPDQRRVAVRGTLRLVNKTQSPITDLHLLHLDPQVEVAQLELPGATQTHFDEELGYRILTLAPAMQPGDSLTLTYEFRKHLRGFGNESPDDSVVANGTFFNSSSFMPQLGYSEQFELEDPNTRREQDLPPRPRMAKIDDLPARQNTYIRSDSDWVEFAATVSTSADQIAVAPGYLVREWEEGGRRYFRYEMDAPILNFWSVLSARYTVARDEWRPPGGGQPVAIEIFYHEHHPYNVAKMIASIKASLDYFTAAYSPYQHRQVRILEFPRYASFAQSFPNTIPYSESIGFIADASAKDDLDYVFYVTSHEVAHQWWAHQVIGANVQGATLMSESLAEYSAIMVMQRYYKAEAPKKITKFMEYAVDNYLQGRSAEAIEELPLLLVESQSYIYYDKASVVFFALSEYIGEQALNAALHDYVAEVAFQEPPYTVSHELYAHLKRATPERYQYLLADMFERITLYDNRALSAKVREREDGKFELTLALQIRKLYADGKGVETEAETLHDWIEVGAYRADETPIYLELHHFDGVEGFDGSATELTILLDEKPSRAGVDPRNLLIDRAPRDNSRAVEAPG